MNFTVFHVYDTLFICVCMCLCMYVYMMYVCLYVFMYKYVVCMYDARMYNSGVGRCQKVGGHTDT